MMMMMTLGVITRTRGLESPSIMSISMNGSTKWTKEHGIPAVTPMGVFSTLCLDGTVTMDEWLTDIEEANVPHAWAVDGWFGILPHEFSVCVHLPHHHPSHPR